MKVMGGGLDYGESLCGKYKVSNSMSALRTGKRGGFCGGNSKSSYGPLYKTFIMREKVVEKRKKKAVFRR